MAESSIPERRRLSLLDRVEWLGNALPDPVFIFVIMIAVLVAVSVVGAGVGWAAVNPITGETLQVSSLLTEKNLRTLFVEMPRTYTGFAPLGLVLTIMLGAAVAERSGVLSALLRAGLAGVKGTALVPTVFVLGLLSTHAVDAGNLVYVPLAALVFRSAGRHPILGIVVAFSGVAVGLSGNLLPGQYDVLILGITETGARLIDPKWTMNPLGNWYFGVGIAVVFTTLNWIIIERVVAPRLGPWIDPDAGDLPDGPQISRDESRGLRAAGIAALLVVGLFAALTLWPGFTPLYDATAVGTQRLMPFFRSLPAALLLLLFASGWAYGAATGTIRSERDIVSMMIKGMEPMVPYLILIFFAAHFVAMFGWSNLGPITAIAGAGQLKAMNAPPAVLLPVLTTMSAWLDFLIASGSAKWAAMAPVAAPMLMLLDISPEMTTAAYRVGDTVTNLISPLNPYVILALGFCQRWVPGFRLGSFLALVVPIAIAFYIGGVLLTGTWVALELPVGPGAAVAYHVVR
jgi:aminobenzoyl-glutamate transport protein